MAATTAILTWCMATPSRRFSDVLAQDCMGADSGSPGPPMDGGARAPYAIRVQPGRTEVNRRRVQEETQEGAQEETNVMTSPIAGGVDCDLHPAVPHLATL